MTSKRQLARATIDLAEYLGSQELAGNREAPESEPLEPLGDSQLSGR